MSGSPTHPHWLDPRELCVLGMGLALPGTSLSNEELLKKVQPYFSPSLQRSGRAVARRLNIQHRYVCRDFAEPIERPRAGNANAELAAQAIRSALGQAGMDVGDLRYLIAHTATPGRLIPPNVARIAELLNYDGPFVELRQACTGFANALIFARGLIDAPGAGPIAIVGSETGSIHFDPRRVDHDESQLVNLLQMGDAAAACVLARNDSRGARISHLYFGQIGRTREPGFQIARGGSDSPAVSGVLEFSHDYRSVRETGPALFRHGVVAANELGIQIEDVDYIVPHQANGRMAQLLGDALRVSPERVFVNADSHGNTGSAAIWLALTQLRTRMQIGERALILGAEATKHMFGGFLYTHA